MPQCLNAVVVSGRAVLAGGRRGPAVGCLVLGGGGGGAGGSGNGRGIQVPRRSAFADIQQGR